MSTTDRAEAQVEIPGRTDHARDDDPGQCLDGLAELLLAAAERRRLRQGIGNAEVNDAQRN